MDQNDREQFWQTLCSLPGNDIVAEREQLFKSIKYPKLLFRYRPVSTKSLEALRTNKLYFSSANYYDDPFDTFLHIDIEAIRKEYLSAFQTPESTEAVVDGVLQAYAFANNDPYRACTNNKGIMNGSSPVACATGNDIRALEAGAHAYAGISGHYRPIVHWEKDNNGDLNGMIELPTAVGIVGGTTKTHPLAGVMLRMMHVESAEELSIVIAATGLAENLWTLRTLATGGIQAEFVPSLERRQETEE